MCIRDSNNTTLWLCSYNQVVNPNVRDLYSSGGQITHVNGTELNKPVAQVFNVIVEFADEIKALLRHPSAELLMLIKDFNPILLEHSDMYLSTVDNTYHYKIFSVYVAINDFRHVNLKFDDEGYAQHLQWWKDKSAYNTGLEVNKYDNVLVIQTCYFNPEGSYLILAAKRGDE